MVGILGATSGAAFLALTPAMTALMGIPILGELPSAIDWTAIVVISIGVYTVSGGPLPGKIVQSQFVNGGGDEPTCRRLDRRP
jgi:drug/metabolite transporter (DMT)-like permease